MAEENNEATNNKETFTVDNELAGHRLDFCLSRYFGLSRNFASTLIKNGAVEIAPSRRLKPSVKVNDGDEILVLLPPPQSLELEPEDVAFDVVYEDTDIIVVNKPAGLVVHPSPGHWTGTLVHGLLYRFHDIGMLNGVERPGIVHRLDSTTSGLMVVARNGLAQESLFKQFKEREVKKVYLALCHGCPKKDKGNIDYPIDRDPFNRLKMACIEGGREASTDYEVIKKFDKYSLVKCTLHSGRTHQIRVHMAAIGCPLVGDTLYSPARPQPFEEPRVFLHAWHLGFIHPRRRKWLDFWQKLPQELLDFISLLQ